jgi:hypothetical protein
MFHSQRANFRSQGTYSGDNAVNRAISHGLGIKPYLVIIQDSDSRTFYQQSCKPSTINHIANGIQAVTDMTISAFYVGNAGVDAEGANVLGKNYYWTALG